MTKEKDHVVFSVCEPDNRNFLMCYICDTDKAFDRELKMFQETYSDSRGLYNNNACFLSFSWENLICIKHIFDFKDNLHGNLFGGLFFHKDTLTYATTTREAYRASAFVNEMLVGYSNTTCSLKRTHYERPRHTPDELLAYRTGAYVDYIIKNSRQI